MHTLRGETAMGIEEIMEVDDGEVEMKAITEAITEVITLEAGETIIMARETTADKAAARMATTALRHRNQAISGEIKAHRVAI